MRSAVGMRIAADGRQPLVGLVARSSAVRMIKRRRRRDLIAIFVIAVSCGTVSVVLVPDWDGLVGGWLALIVVLIAAVDGRYFVIPDGLTALALGLGFISAAVAVADALPVALALAGLRGAGLAVLFLCLHVVYRRLRGFDGIGLGDVKLAGVAGVWLDWLTIPLAIELAAFAALSTYLATRILFGRPVGMTTRIPFGLFFAPAIWLAWLIGAAFLRTPVLSSF